MESVGSFEAKTHLGNRRQQTLSSAPIPNSPN